MLENIKNQYVGKPHFPHSYMVEFGIHALTLKGTFDPKLKSTLPERERILKTMGLLEQLYRVDDQLDEQLHAGYYFYLLTSKSTFVSNSGFVYPLVMILWGFFITNFIFYNETYAVEQDENLVSAGVFLAISYALGFLFMITPNLYFEYLGKSKLRSELCLGGPAF